MTRLPVHGVFRVDPFPITYMQRHPMKQPPLTLPRFHLQPPPPARVSMRLVRLPTFIHYAATNGQLRRVAGDWHDWRLALNIEREAMR